MRSVTDVELTYKLLHECVIGLLLTLRYNWQGGAIQNRVPATGCVWCGWGGGRAKRDKE